MQRTRHNQGPLVKTLGKVRVTPHSLILSIPIFIVFALINVTHVTLILQAFFLGIAVLLCGFSLRGMRFLPLLPLLLFIFVFNSFRGGGEILFRAGPLIIMQQGVGRGLYYALFVMELFTMSTILTRSFTEHDLGSALYTINRLFSRGKGAQDPARTGGFALMLFYILRIFHGAYTEIGIFFKKGSRSFRERTLLFVHTLFRQAMHDYERADVFSPEVLKPQSGDVVFVLSQIFFLVSAVFLGHGVPG